MTTGTGILLASVLLGGIYLVTRKTGASAPVTWNIEWDDDLPTVVTIQGQFKVLV